MEFIADKQTLADLNILGKYTNNSLFYIFNQVKTQGGEKLLDQLFRHPLTNPEDINTRSKTFQYFQDRDISFPFELTEFGIMESYLYSGGSGSWWQTSIQFLRRRGLKSLGLAKEYDQVKEGITMTIKLLGRFRAFLQVLQVNDPANPFSIDIEKFERRFTEGKLTAIANAGSREFSNVDQIRFDHLLRNTLHKELNEVLSFVYTIDVYLSVAAVARKRGFTYATALPREAFVTEIEDCRHPAILHGIGNPVEMNGTSNVVFLTGANMAGKSTFMKSVGIAVYMAHMGFPLAVKRMRFSVKSGIITSINVPDDLNQGFSHFYAEVLRVKQVAQLVKDNNDIVVIFDELFKGTNVKDAYDATLACTKAFSDFRNCNYIISTHIIEVGEALREKASNIQFRFMPTIMEGNIPRYPYRIREGITEDRHGMTIIQNEKILDIILA
jgi:DNA mismatch repair ATPase MutS